MIRRLVRILVAAFCLLSLLGAAGIACLWWESRGGQGYVAEASILGTYVVVELLPDSQGGILVVRRWPGPPSFRVWSQHGYYNEHPIYWTTPRLQSWHLFRLTGQSGQLSVLIRTDTRTRRTSSPGFKP